MATVEHTGEHHAQQHAGTSTAPRQTATQSSLIQGEQRLTELPASGGGEFVLTTDRVYYAGGREEDAVFASARLEDIAAIEISRRARDKRALVWAAIAFISAVAVWQIASDSPVGPVAGAVVSLVGFGLLFDYFLRPFGYSFRLHTRGVAIAGVIPAKNLQRARDFSSAIEGARAEKSARPSSAGTATVSAQTGTSVRLHYPPV